MRAFEKDAAADKRAKLIDKLLASPEYAEYWADVWTVRASAAVLLEAFFWVRLVRFLRRPEAGLTFSWHAADFAVGFLALGAIMVAALITASRSAGVDAGDGLAHRAPSS